MPESYSQHQPRDRSLRAGDGDRNAVADILREQHLAGRLESDEFQERLDRCYTAKTYDQLDGLIADFPSEEPARPPRRAWRSPAVALVALLVAAIALSAGHLFWLVIPLFFFFGRPLLWRSSGRRYGWGAAGCRVRQSPPPGSYI
jgi:Domain of unknown function (DUF1707)